MPYAKAKVYSDGSHYIAIPPTKRKTKPKLIKKEQEIYIDENRKLVPEAKEEQFVIVTEKGRVLEEVEWKDGEWKKVYKKPKNKGTKTTRKKLFESLYREYYTTDKAKLREKLVRGMIGCFKNRQEAEFYVDGNLDRKRRNAICRKTRMVRKINLQKWNWFCTFTYRDELHSEKTFREKLSNCLKLFAYRKGWKYIGVWERSLEKNRLHFHGIFYIPDGTMPGKLEKKSGFSFEKQTRVDISENTYFAERFGRNDFSEVVRREEIGASMAYLIKYIEKSGEKLVYSRKLPTYFVSDVLDDDIVCPFGMYEQKFLLFDDFKCFDEGCFIGQVSPEVIEQMPKSN